MSSAVSLYSPLFNLYPAPDVQFLWLLLDQDNSKKLSPVDSLKNVTEALLSLSFRFIDSMKDFS